MMDDKHRSAEAETDDNLIVRIAAQDQAAAQILVQKHLDFVLRVCQQKLGDRQQAEDAAQEVFLAVWRKASTWQPGRAKVTTWLYRIATNKSIDILRKHRAADDIDDFDQLSGDEPEADHVLSVADDRRLLAAALARLSQPQRRAVELYYFDQIKQDEAAKQMDLSIAAFESVLRRARQALHTELALQRPFLSVI
jgi:RNA polymerase sigma-70 factor (ECF subfamily)